jgi:hypothetical protein
MCDVRTSAPPLLNGDSHNWEGHHEDFPRLLFMSLKHCLVQDKQPDLV